MNERIKQACEECKQIRLMLGITQQEMAERLQTTQANISQFENGKIDNLNFYVYYKELVYDKEVIK